MAIDFDLKIEMAALDKFDAAKPTPSFINSAVFPHFKNLEERTRIEFEYPITALVGANGTGKSSILHALWGMPQGNSTSRFWFSTDVDKIYSDGAAGVPRYWYSHWLKDLKKYVESKKVFGRKRLGYWEPARALKSDGMAVMPPTTREDQPFRSQDRWNQTVRDVIYINFKCELSAFERFFYFDDGSNLSTKQASYLHGATRLERVLTGKLTSYSPGGKQAVFENRQLSSEEIDWVGYILGRTYVSAQYVRHRLLTGNESPTVLFRRKELCYSEAAAGSGELAVTRAVIQLLKAKTASLVLLDEPETSLHPGAQTAFMEFLFRLARTKRLQIVMSTHSPTLVSLLPAKAIKALEETAEGKSRVTSVSHPSMAFNRLGHVTAEKLTVAIEDELLKGLVELATLQLDPGEKDLLVLYVPPGGASSILCHEIPAWIHTGQSFYAILDGDQRPRNKLEPVSDMNQHEMANLGERILQELKTNPDHIGNNIEKTKMYWEWVRNRLRFLEDICPEAVLLKEMIGPKEARSFTSTNKDAKKKLISVMEERSHKTDAAALVAAISFIIPDRGLNNTTIKTLADDLRGFIADHEIRRRQL